MDNETKRYIDDSVKRLEWNTLWICLWLSICISVSVICADWRIDKLERKPASQATLSEADIKALLDYGSRVNAMWNERTEAKKAEKLKNEAYERALKGEVGLLPGVE